MRDWRSFLVSIGCSTLLACSGTMPTLGGSKGNAATGSAAGATASGANSQLEHCEKTLGTMGVDEDQGSGWYQVLTAQHKLPSTVPLLRLLIQQSNCFVIVERGSSFNNMMGERQLAESGELRQQSNMGKGQMVAADYTLRPTINFSEQGTGGVGGALGGLLGGPVIGAIVGGMKSNEASTTLLLIDNRSSVQLSASQGSAKNWDLAGGLGTFFGSGAAGLGGYSNTPQGKLLAAAFMDSFNQMVRGLPQYQAQTVEGGLGTGGSLGVSQ